MHLDWNFRVTLKGTSGHPWAPIGTHGHPWLNGVQNLAPLGVQMNPWAKTFHLHTQGCQVLYTV